MSIVARQSDDVIKTISTMFPTAACWTLVLFEKHREIVANNLSKAGWSWGCVSAIDSNGRTMWIVDAHRDNGKRFIVRAGEKLTAFIELESACTQRASSAKNSIEK
jgi:hypothetical protein